MDLSSRAKLIFFQESIWAVTDPETKALIGLSLFYLSIEPNTLCINSLMASLELFPFLILA